MLSLLAGTTNNTTGTNVTESSTEEVDPSSVVGPNVKPAKLSAKARKAVAELQALMKE